MRKKNQKEKIIFKLFPRLFYIFILLLSFNFLMPAGLKSDIAIAAGLQNLHEDIQTEAITSENKAAQNLNAAALSPNADEKKYVMAILSDTHVSEETYNAKEKVIEILNGWNDVDSVAVAGDLCSEVGSEKEYKIAAKLFKNLKHPKYFITGNHDYLYEDAKDKDDKKIRASEAVNKLKLNRFKNTFDQKSLYFSKKINNYLFIFLSVDASRVKYIATLSKTQLKWLADTLEKNKDTPTVIVCHAPLTGTFVHHSMDMKHCAIQPEDKIDDMIKDNPQVFMWVSGHTHIKPTSSDYDSKVNVYKKQVTNIHNGNMSKNNNWINTLSLYDNYIIVKTYDCKKKKWLDKFERKVKVPEKFIIKTDNKYNGNETLEAEIKLDPEPSVTSESAATTETEVKDEETIISTGEVIDGTEEVRADGRIADDGNADNVKVELEKIKILFRNVLKQIYDLFSSLKANW